MKHFIVTVSIFFSLNLAYSQTAKPVKSYHDYYQTVVKEEYSMIETETFNATVKEKNIFGVFVPVDNFNVTAGVIHGKYKYYEMYDGSTRTYLETEGNYKYGLKDGEFKHYHSNGQLKEKSKWIDGVAVGERTLYDENGNPTAKFEFPATIDAITYNEDEGAALIEGKYYSFYDGGQGKGNALQQVRFSTDNGIPVTTAKFFVVDTLDFFDTDDFLYCRRIIQGRATYPYFEDLKTFSIYYHENGKVQKEGIETNTRTGLWHFFWDTGLPLMDVEYSDYGKIINTSNYYHENGQLYFSLKVFDGYYGTQKDTLEIYNESGVKEFELDESTFDCKYYYPNGKIKAQGKKGKYIQEGSSEYYKLAMKYQGSMRCVTESQGMPIGEWIYYNESGKIINKETYDPCNY